MFQAGANVQGALLPLPKQGRSSKGPGNEVSRKCNGENRPGFIAEFSDSQVGKMLVRFEPGGIRRQALCASRVIQRNHFVHYGVQGVALAIAVINMGGRRRSRDLWD